MGKAIHEFNIPMKYLLTLVILHIIYNPLFQVSMNVSDVAKPRNFVPMKLNDFTVYSAHIYFMQVVSYIFVISHSTSDPSHLSVLSVWVSKS